MMLQINKEKKNWKGVKKGAEINTHYELITIWND